MNGFEMRQNIKIKEYLNRNKLKTRSPLPIDVLLKKNQHTLVVMTASEFWDFLVKYYQKKGLSDQDIMLLVIEKLVVKGHTAAKRIQQDWQENRESIKTLSGFVPSFIDAKALTILAYDLKRGGNLWSKYRIQNYMGGSYIILDGNHRLRRYLTGTRYLANNPKVVSMGLGKAGISNALRGGGIVTVVFSAMFHGIDQLMNDELTWHHFVGGLAEDVIIAATASGVVLGLVNMTGIAVTGLAIGPLMIVIAAGAITTGILTSIFNGQLKDLFVSCLKSIEKHAKQLSTISKLLFSYGVISVRNNIEDSLFSFQQKVERLTLKSNKFIRDANDYPQGFLYRLFNIPDTRELFE